MRYPVVTTLLTFASLGVLWAVSGSVIAVVVFAAISGSALAAWPIILIAVVFAAVAGVPLGLVAGGGALIGLQVRQSTLAAALGSAVAVAIVLLPVWLLGGLNPISAAIAVGLVALAGALTPLTLRFVGKRQVVESPWIWLIVAGIVAAIAALVGVPFSLWGKDSLAVPISSLAFAAASAVLLVAGVWLTRGRRGVPVTVLVVITGVGLVLLVAGQVLQIMSFTGPPPEARPTHEVTPPESSAFTHDGIGVAMQELYNRTAEAAGAEAVLVVPVTDFCGSADLSGVTVTTRLETDDLGAGYAAIRALWADEGYSLGVGDDGELTAAGSGDLPAATLALENTGGDLRLQLQSVCVPHAP